jgi:hypothetical protein
MPLDQFTGKLANSGLGDLIGTPSAGGRSVDAAKAASGRLPFRLEISLALHGVQHRIERPRTYRIAVATKLVDHPLAIDIPLDRMKQNVQPDQAAQQILIFHRARHEFSLDKSESKFLLAHFVPAVEASATETTAGGQSPRCQINMSVRDLPAQIPRIQISGGSILKPGARGSQQVIMFVEIVDNADIEASAVDAIDGISRLIEYLAADA